MTMPVTSVDDVFALFATRGGEHYGESITQIDHALQCAALAVADGAPDALVAAALLHDIGHLVANLQGAERFDLELDDDHEAVGARVLTRLFGPDVAAPVALHVTAKRWRCTVEPSYHDGLSLTSKATLKAQGGPLDDEACTRFKAHPASAAALSVRTWDDLGKVDGLVVNPLEHYRDLLEGLATAR
jgi:phosphonate degradation associated HDIG domain protein